MNEGEKILEKFINTRNPVLPLKYHIPDSEAHVMPDGKLYIYGSFDDRADVFCSERYYVASTEDMEHWTIYDEAFNGSSVSWFRDPEDYKYPGIDWSRPTPFIRKMLEEEAKKGKDMKAAFEQAAMEEKPALLFAPDCLPKNGTYYLYFCMPDDSEGVARAKMPYGPFTDPVKLPCGGIDPAVFIDSDGQAYYYWGQLFSHGVKLDPGMTSFNENEVVHDLVTEEEHCFHEGSSMRKIGDTYYYVYADMERGKPTALGYSTGASPLGPFTYRGIIIDNDGCDPASWNNHGSIECVDGQWYVFYHRCSRGKQQYRRLCIERITIGEDGTIPEVKMTSQGIGEPFAPGETIMGFQACGVQGQLYIGVNEAAGEDSAEPLELLTNISDGDTAVFRYVKSGKPWEKIRITCRGKGKIHVFMNGRAAGSVTADAPEGTQVCEGTLSMDAGEYELVLKLEKPEMLEILSLALL